MQNLREPPLDFSEKEPDAQLVSVDTAANDVWGVVYRFLTTKDLGKMARVSKKQRELSENDIHWGARAIQFNAHRLKTKLSIRLFYVLSKSRIYEEYDCGTWIDVCVSVIVKNPQTNEIKYHNNLTYIHCEIDRQPIIAYWIMKEPIFNKLLASQYPEELKQKWVAETAKKIVGAIVGGLIGFIAATLCAVVLLPIWLISVTLCIITCCMIPFMCIKRYAFTPRFNLLDTPFTVLNSAVHGVHTGYHMGLRGMRAIIKDSTKAIYASYFVPKKIYNECDYCTFESCSYLHKRLDSIADTAKQQQLLRSQSLFAAKPRSKEIDKSAHLAISPLRM